ncbi:hypothetical protein IEQ34_019420 [Dendrobium chrysotoxum]|uniref:Uncharacterized protein n=1 Tax=Dendrobium chrysotoxum TaxID=161865 RepID=A0AAV7G7B9_DENCH|nr:hypothetical protein IEQ34_019420 [Dendrobium chrysotoxum]
MKGGGGEKERSWKLTCRRPPPEFFPATVDLLLVHRPSPDFHLFANYRRTSASLSTTAEFFPATIRLSTQQFGVVCGKLITDWRTTFAPTSKGQEVSIGSVICDPGFDSSMKWLNLSIGVYRKVVSLNLYCRVIL